MKLCNFIPRDEHRVFPRVLASGKLMIYSGILIGEKIFTVSEIAGLKNAMPIDATDYLFALKFAESRKEVIAAIGRGDANDFHSLSIDEVVLHPPVMNPGSFRDFYAFEEHVRNANALRGRAVPDEWYEFPVFYFSNAKTMMASGAQIKFPHGGERLDFELEMAAVVGRNIKNASPEEAEAAIAGYTILNDWSIRDVQRREMAVGLGPAKGKDFATSLGPFFVTPDELADRRAGKGFDLSGRVRVNGEEITSGNFKTISYSFGEMIARASLNCELYPGDVIGSGTMGRGCLLEIGEETLGRWLVPGDRVELEIERLGTLENTVVE